MTEILVTENRGSPRSIPVAALLAAVLSVPTVSESGAAQLHPYLSTVTTYRSLVNSSSAFGGGASVKEASGDLMLDQAIKSVMNDLVANQQSLGLEFEAVLFENLANLYIED